MRFSVIVPLYNKAPYVEKALRSVLAQTFADYELIVVNDGSKDDSLAVAKRVLDGSGAIIIDQENAGVSTARNNGVAASHGDYICFLDADDWWEPRFLERMSWFVDEYSEALLFATNYHYVKNGQSVVKLNIPTGYFNYCKVYSEFLCQPVWTGAACMPRSIFDEFGGFRPHLKLGEDFDLWIKIALKYKVAFLNEPLANYNQDVDVANRGTHHLQKPEYHMLWNLDYHEGEERTNPDYKQLIDNLRTYSLLPYFISKEYHKPAKEQLNKVDWSHQPERLIRLYKRPIWYLRTRDKFYKIGSRIKQFILKQV